MGACARTHMIHKLVGAWTLAGLLTGGLAGSAVAEVPADNGAVVIMYHRFGESDLPATNIRLDQFEVIARPTGLLECRFARRDWSGSHDRRIKPRGRP